MAKEIWIMELRLLAKNGEPGLPERWEAIGPAAMPRYEYATREEAEHMLAICYPDQLREERLGGPQIVRVREVGRLVDGYPTNWPKCPGCGRPALDGKATCGDVACK